MTYRIAFVTARYPPMRTSGTYRVEAVMEFLPEHGFDIEVVTLPTQWMEYQSRQALGDASVGAHQPEAMTDGLVRYLSTVRYLNWVQRAILVPDLLALWARATARQMSKELHRIDAVYGTSPPYSGIVVAQRLADALGVPCIQELRDPPSFHRALRRRSAFYSRRMLRFERKYLTRADQVITVTPRTRQRLLDLHPGLDPARLHVVTNGYPEVDVDPTLAGRDPEKFTITYVGTFQGSVKARESSVFTPAVLMEALSALPADKVSLRIVGSVSSQQKKNLRKLDPNGVAEFTGLLDREFALAETAAADVAVILADDDDWWIGRKAFEYLRHAHTILAIVPPGDTTDLLESHSRVDVVSPNDLAAIPAVVRARFEEWIRGDWERGPIPGTIQTDRACVAEIAGVLTQAITDANPPMEI
jgi:glycosyltransferase involved in cell wall biosynthesis